LKQNPDTVIRTLPGWKTTRLIAAKDGGDRKPRRFTSPAALRPRKLPRARSPHRQTLWGTEPSRTFAGSGWRLETNAANTPTRRGDRKAHQPRFAPELRRIGGGA
jgi:hypothetical protein